MAVRRRRRSSVLFGAGFVIALVLGAVGLVLAIRGYRADDGASGAVRGYFTALARDKARTALAYGAVPPGPRTLLTAPVLKAQLKTAPLRDFAIAGVDRDGVTATVQVRYTLAFPGAPQKVTATVPVSHRTGHWRLLAVAVASELRTDTAQDRVVTFGPEPANGTSLMFPGALPLTFDTPLLALEPASDHIEFGAAPVTDVVVNASASGTEQARAAVLSALRECLTGSGSTTCPQPSQRYVPGSLRGTLAPGAAPLSVTVNDAAGVLTVSGTVSVTGTYQRLTFANRAVVGTGTVQLPISAQAYARTPLTFVWTQT